MEKRSAFGVYSGPQRLSTEDQANPTAGPVHEKTPLFKVNGITVSSTKVFIVDDVIVIFIGTEMGEVRKVYKKNINVCSQLYITILHCVVHYSKLDYSCIRHINVRTNMESVYQTSGNIRVCKRI